MGRFILFTVPRSENIKYLQITLPFSLPSFSVGSTVKRALKEPHRQKGHLVFIMFKQHFYLLSLDNNHENNFSTEYWALLFQMIFCKRGLHYEENVDLLYLLIFFFTNRSKSLKHLPWISAGETSHPRLAKGGQDCFQCCLCSAPCQ